MLPRGHFVCWARTIWGQITPGLKVRPNWNAPWGSFRMLGTYNLGPDHARAESEAKLECSLGVISYAGHVQSEIRPRPAGSEAGLKYSLGVISYAVHGNGIPSARRCFGCQHCMGHSSVNRRITETANDVF